jgi:glycosyltransferase involved in cell wall biosynthesis
MSTAAGLGGTERVVVALAHELSNRGLPVRAVFPAVEGSDAIVRWAAQEGADVEVNRAVSEVHKHRTVADIIRLARFVRASKAECVNLHYGVNHISIKDVLAVRLAGCRCVVTVHHAVPYTNARTRLLTRLSARIANTVIAVSESVRALLKSAGVPDRRIEIAFTGLTPLERVYVRDDLRRTLGISPQAFVIGSLARLVPEKGIADLIEAVAELAPAADRPWLIIAGEGPIRRELEQLGAERLGDRVRFLGRVADTGDLYGMCDVFALPSYEEGFGLVFIEAALHGVPSIGSNVGGVPEAIDDGVTGCLVAPYDRDALVEVLARFRADPELCTSMGRAARTRANERFSASVMADRYLQILLPGRFRGVAARVPDVGQG